jgi:cytoskeletal protein RodZ
MIDLGNELRQAREAKGLSLAEAEADTRIKEYYLRALETNDWAALPTPVQAQGFLRNYATYLGLDEKQIMARFGQLARSPMTAMPLSKIETQGRTTGEDGAVFNPRDISIESSPRVPAWLSSDIVVGIALALLLIVVVWGASRLLSNDSGDGTATPRATSALFVPALTNTAPQPTSGAEIQPPATTPTFDASIEGVQLALQATEHVWVRVTVDGAIVLEGILAPGLPQTWQGTQQIKLEAANGAGLQATVNGQPLGVLGERGQQVVLAWGPGGPVAP